MKKQLLVGMGTAALLAMLSPNLRAQGAGRCDELWAAAMDDNVTSISELVQAGVNVNCRDPQTAETPLMAAATNGKVEAVKLLLSLGANANVKNAHGDTALDMARDHEKAFSQIPNLAGLAEHQRQVIALLTPRTTGADGPHGTRPPLVVKPADPDMVAHFKLESAHAALLAGLNKDALGYASDVLALSGVSEANRASAFAVAGEASMRTKDWAQAKRNCEKVLAMPDADPDDKDNCKENLKTLRKYFPEMFQ